MKPRPNSSRTERNHQLDGLRGYAALTVVVFHTILTVDKNLVDRIIYGHVAKFHTAYEWFAKIVLKIFSGETAVFIFFALSGAVLSQSLLQSRQPFASQAVDFMLKRFFRIYPPLLLNLFVMMTCLLALGRTTSAGDFLGNALLVEFPVNGVTWTLNVEMVAVGFILAAYAGWRIGREWGLLATSICLGLALKLPLWPAAIAIFKDQWPLFALGMLIPTPLGFRLVSHLPSVAGPLFLLVAVIFKGTLQPIAIAFFIALLYYRKTGAFGRCLENHTSQFFGRISYSIYLYHPVILVLISDRVTGWELAVSHPVELGLALAIPIVIATLFLAYLSARFVEEPSIALGRTIALSVRFAHPR